MTGTPQSHPLTVQMQRMQSRLSQVSQERSRYMLRRLAHQNRNHPPVTGAAPGSPGPALTKVLRERAGSIFRTGRNRSSTTNTRASQALSEGRSDARSDGGPRSDGHGVTDEFGSAGAASASNAPHSPTPNSPTPNSPTPQQRRPGSRPQSP